MLNIPTFKILGVLLFTMGVSSCSSSGQQTPGASLRGSPCEGCEAVFEFGSRVLKSVDSLPDFSMNGPRLKVTGIVLKPDRKTPAADVILYIYHTDQNGIYAKKGGEKGWGKRHGYIRGWIKTGKDGRYTFYTLKPGTYPSREEPAHIHATLLEPGGKYYYIDEWHFRGDPLLFKLKGQAGAPYGGSGLVTLAQEGHYWVARRAIILGLNLPDYD